MERGRLIEFSLGSSTYRSLTWLLPDDAYGVFLHGLSRWRINTISRAYIYNGSKRCLGTICTREEISITLIFPWIALVVLIRHL